ncbi:MAG: PEP-utilizing enzyme [Patescibacteria group bacterium]|nr:PEP-utilizing enzyme [Patescibacteria group bacterium]
MGKINLLKRALKKDWYVQGFNAVPSFLNLPAYSGFAMKRELGFGYSMFIHNYANGYGEMWYLADDFRRIWGIVKNKLKRNPDYLKQQKRRYSQIFQPHRALFKKIDRLDLKKIFQGELMAILKKLNQAQMDSVGISHLVDAVGIEIENEFKKSLFAEIKNKDEFNHYFGILTAPTKLSFIAREELELKKLLKFSSRVRKEKLPEHAKKYFWILNSYAGVQELKADFFAEKLKKIAAAEKKNAVKNPPEKIKLSRATEAMAKIINFAAIWQDERKAETLRTVGYLARLLKEIARRMKIPYVFLLYLGVKDMRRIKSFKDIRSLKNQLEIRKSGVVFLTNNSQEYSYTEKTAKKLIAFKNERITASEENKKEIHGSIANIGTAVGRAIICRDLASLAKVEVGDVVVASMTRPEFMTALKKAAAIVTDEGGITSHAAIISRELGIPAIIGTKVATKVLKTGMLLEVRANHGVVKILR